MDALLKVVGSNRLSALRVICVRPPGRLGGA